MHNIFILLVMTKIIARKTISKKDILMSEGKNEENNDRKCTTVPKNYVYVPNFTLVMLGTT
jgi:hypothetical protein